MFFSHDFSRIGNCRGRIHGNPLIGRHPSGTAAGGRLRGEFLWMLVDLAGQLSGGEGLAPIRRQRE
jgi:hypothetical protein